MGTYKGNKGNLMQHWTLCEVLSVANRHHSALNYIDAHAMAPLAMTRTDDDVVFDRVRNALPNGTSIYEKTWYDLVRGGNSYPSSANLVTKVWAGSFSLLLCEIRRTTADEIEHWLGDVCSLRGYCLADLDRGDWRNQFKQGLPSPTDVGLGHDALTLISFDPYTIGVSLNKDLPEKKQGNMYPQDLALVANAVEKVEGGVLLQLSTYSANVGILRQGANSQVMVTAMIDNILGQAGFKLAAKTRPDGNMMSLIYARDIPWADDLAKLGVQFTEWYQRVR